MLKIVHLDVVRIIKNMSCCLKGYFVFLLIYLIFVFIPFKYYFQLHLLAFQTRIFKLLLNHLPQTRSISSLLYDTNLLCAQNAKIWYTFIVHQKTLLLNHFIFFLPITGKIVIIDFGIQIILNTHIPLAG